MFEEHPKVVGVLTTVSAAGLGAFIIRENQPHADAITCVGPNPQNQAVQCSVNKIELGVDTLGATAAICLITCLAGLARQARRRRKATAEIRGERKLQAAIDREYFHTVEEIGLQNDYKDIEGLY